MHLTINGEEIITTADHPFYVKNIGFVNAGELQIDDKLLNSNGEVLIVEDTLREIAEIPVPVYNFQVEDFHTYFVGEAGVWVHNDCFEDVVNNPKSLYGKSKSDIATQLEFEGGWSEGVYGKSNKNGWKFMKEDKLIFYHATGGRHEGEYYGFSSAKTGIVKIVGNDYIPIFGDKAKIIYNN